MDPRPGPAASGSTYHSFNDMELLEPPLGPSSVESRAAPPREPAPLRDPGKTPPPRRCGSRPAPSRRASNASSAGPRASTPRRRPAARQSPPSYPQPGPQRPHPRQPVAYFQFPVPDLVELAAPPDPEPPPPPPPQTTHYWTSNSTRRLEYAAIDAASRGFRGWLRRHLVPDCFLARHVAFDDDSGSVRRYRLALDDDDDDNDDDEAAEKDAAGPRASRRPKGWSFWPLRRSSTF